MGRKAFLIIQSVLCVLLVILMSVSAVGIYREGVERKAEKPLEWIYTRERAEESFGKLAPLFWIAVGMTVVGLILEVRDENAEKPVRDVRLNRDLAVSRVAAPSEAMKKERARQNRLTAVAWTAFGLCMVPILLYCCKGVHFPNGDLEPVFRSLLIAILPWTVVGLGCLAVTAILREKSMQRETEAARVQHEAEKAEGVCPGPEVKKAPKQKRVKLAQILALCIAVLLIAAGVFNGGARDVLYKAAKICTECVGLG